jgi:hypothetical protein
MNFAELQQLVRAADPDPRRVKAVIGLGAGTQLVFQERLRSTDLVTGPCPPNWPLVSFRPVVRLMHEVIAELGPHAAELMARHREGLRFLDPALVGEEQPRVSPLDSHAVAYAIVRRISRESLHAAVRIDQAARFLLAALRVLADRAAQQAGPAPDGAHRTAGVPDDGRLTLWIPDADLLDRPSMRLINRLQWLREPQDRIDIVVLYRGDPLAAPASEPEPEPAAEDRGPRQPAGLRERLRRARVRLFERLHQEWNPAEIRVRQAGPLLPEPLSADRLPPAGSDPVAAVAENLVDHNYDRAYLLAELLLSQGASGSR